MGMIIQFEQKHHFGIISQKEREKLRNKILKNEKTLEKKRSKRLSEFQICDILVEKVANEKNNSKLLDKINKYITSKYSSRDIYWCRLILLTRTPFRDKCLDLLLES